MSYGSQPFELDSSMLKQELVAAQIELVAALCEFQEEYGKSMTTEGVYVNPMEDIMVKGLARLQRVLMSMGYTPHNPAKHKDIDMPPFGLTGNSHKTFKWSKPPTKHKPSFGPPF